MTMVISNPVNAQDRDERVAGAQCRENRRAISGSIEIYYIEYPETYGMITIDMLLRSGALTEMPYCPRGGEYSIDANGEVYCAIHQPNPSLQPVAAAPPPEETAPEEPPPAIVENIDPPMDLPMNSGDDDPFIRPGEIVEDPGMALEEPPVIETPDLRDDRGSSKDKLVTAQDLGGNIRRGSGPSMAAAGMDLGEILGGGRPVAARDKPSAKRYLTAFEHNRRGMELAEAMKFDEARGHFQKALDLSPDSKIYLYNMALNLARMGELDRSRYHLSRAKRLDPGNTRIQALEQMIQDRMDLGK